MNHRRALFVALALLAALIAPQLARSENTPQTTIRSQSFDRDPGWDAKNNRIVPKEYPTVNQDFGYSPTNFAGREIGEIGGRVQRSSVPAFYAEKIAPKTLNDKLSMSGTFAVTSSGGGGGIFFGWFNARQPGDTGRPIGCLGLEISFEKSGGRPAGLMVTRSNLVARTSTIETHVPARIRPTPIRNDGTRYDWTFEYDPQAADGNGLFQFTIRARGSAQSDWQRKTFLGELPPGYKQDGATFDRFGLTNLLKAGGQATIYFDDVRRDATLETFSQDPHWVGSGNRSSFQEQQPVGFQSFGFSPTTSFAGGAPGEIGGSFWRTPGAWGYYADSIGPLTLADRLEARGKVQLVAAGPDADMYLGWFRGHDVGSPTGGAKLPTNFVGVAVGGPTRVGHYFAPAYSTSKHNFASAQPAPRLTPGKVYEWSLRYDPAADDGQGAIHVTLGGESVKLALKPGSKAEGAMLDHFGMFTAGPGGSMVKIFFDDLDYNSGN